MENCQFPFFSVTGVLSTSQFRWLVKNEAEQNVSQTKYFKNQLAAFEQYQKMVILIIDPRKSLKICTILYSTE